MDKVMYTETNNSGADMNKKTLNKFKKLFEDRRKEIYIKIKEQSVEVDVSGDDIDKAQGNALGDLTQNISRRNVKQIQDIDKALLKIEDGSFGVCEECGADIGEKRLIAKPDAEMCIVCAEQNEHEMRQFS